MKCFLFEVITASRIEIGPINFIVSDLRREGLQIDSCSGSSMWWNFAFILSSELQNWPWKELAIICFCFDLSLRAYFVFFLVLVLVNGKILFILFQFKHCIPVMPQKSRVLLSFIQTNQHIWNVRFQKLDFKLNFFNKSMCRYNMVNIMICNFI